MPVPRAHATSVILHWLRSSSLASEQTYPELGEISIGGVIGFVVGIQQDGYDVLLLLGQLGPQTVF